MKNKNLLLKSVLILILCAINHYANAQIIYTDVNPDVTTTPFNLDLNNDGTMDFYFTNSYVSTGSCNIIPKRKFTARVSSINSNFFFGNITNNPSALNLGDLIDDNYTWNTIADTLYYRDFECTYSILLGNWNSTTDHYLPVKFISGGNNYFGWIRMNIVAGLGPNPIAFKVKDYAYNSISNQPILSGDSTCVLPTINVTASGATTFCYGSSVSLTADSASGYTFQWQKNAIAISGATARSYKVTTSGSYSVVTTNACGTVASTPLSCTRITNPTPVISTTDPLSYCTGQTINTMFTANTYAGVTYQWQKNSVNISGAIAQNYTAAATGKYRVRETAYGCSRTSSAKSIVINCRIQNDDAASSVLSIYPNPASNSITIQFPSDQNENTESAEVQIVNLFGQVLFSKKVNADQMQIDVSKFSTGMYVVRYNSSGYTETKTFSVVK